MNTSVELAIANVPLVGVPSVRGFQAVPYGDGHFRTASGLPIGLSTPDAGCAAGTEGRLISISPATDKLIRVINSDTDKTLWQYLLPAGVKATPRVFETGARQ